MFKVFVDGSEGTTGLRIMERLQTYPDIEVLQIVSEKRKDKEERKKLLNQADIAILCLPDEAAMESVSLIENPNAKVLDTSTAHRTNAEWVYGFSELGMDVKAAKRVAVPGCHASGFIALTAPLVKAGLIEKGARLSCHSITGYSGGGKKMIAEYEQGGAALESPRQYGLTQNHKHLKEMAAYAGLNEAPVFSPIVANFYAGMVVTVPLFDIAPEKLKNMYEKYYENAKLIKVLGEEEMAALNGFLPANALAGRDNMEIIVCGNEKRSVVCARFDNLGKGSSGAALQCMNLMLGNDELTGLCI
jgi:N-acetyl-gamma-glutamyl-phosphate reductase, uncommon form